MAIILLKDNIGKWLVPEMAVDKSMYQITGEKEFTLHHMEDRNYPTSKISYATYYDNSGRWFKLISDEEAQEILRNRPQPSPYNHVIKKIREMEARRERMGYVY